MAETASTDTEALLPESACNDRLPWVDCWICGKVAVSPVDFVKNPFTVVAKWVHTTEYVVNCLLMKPAN
jgi:hypothetical protein